MPRPSARIPSKPGRFGRESALEDRSEIDSARQRAKGSPTCAAKSRRTKMVGDRRGGVLHEQCRLNLKRDALGQATSPRLDIVTAQKLTLKNDKRGVVVAVGARSQAQFVKQ